MIDSRTNLTVMEDNNGSFVDRTENASDYLRDDFTMILNQTIDYLYVGFRKPINTFYIEFTTPNNVANTLTAEIYNGTAWEAISIHDDTRGFTRNGFISWTKDDMNSTTINSIDKYYIRFQASASHSTTIVKAINLIFSCDHMLEEEFYEIMNTNILPSGQTTHITTHVASRNHIVQKLRALGYIKNDSNGDYVNIDQWDLHDIFEIRSAATYLALSKIFFNLSDSVDDNWWQKYQAYQNKFEEMFNVAKLSIDIDDDGLNEDSENLRQTSVVRWNR